LKRARKGKRRKKKRARLFLSGLLARKFKLDSSVYRHSMSLGRVHDLILRVTRSNFYITLVGPAKYNKNVLLGLESNFNDENNFISRNLKIANLDRDQIKKKWLN